MKNLSTTPKETNLNMLEGKKKKKGEVEQLVPTVRT